jgi:hypothetical protein
MIEFTSLNPYQEIKAIVAESPEELTRVLRSIMTPFKIVAMTSYGTRQVAYITGHLPPTKQKKSKEDKNASKENRT